MAHWILGHEHPLFFQAQIAQALRYSAGAVAEELSRLVALGMLEKEPKTGSERRQYYRRTDSPLWKVIRAAVDALTIEGSDDGLGQ